MLVCLVQLFFYFFIFLVFAVVERLTDKLLKIIKRLFFLALWDTCKLY